MTFVCFYFQVHQPHRLKPYSFFDIGNDHFYEDDEKNAAILRKVAEKCYIPANKLMLELIRRMEGRFRISYSISGTAMDQFQRFSPETLDLFKELADTGCVEFLSETYNHSLASLFSVEEFRQQVSHHRQLMRDEFGQVPVIFRNTELIYNNAIAGLVESMGYDAILTEGADHVIEWRSPNFLYRPEGCDHLKLLLKNYRLSDDIEDGVKTLHPVRVGLDQFGLGQLGDIVL